MVHFPIHRGPVLAILAVALALMIPACKVDRDSEPEGSGAPLGLEGWAMGTSWRVLALAPASKRAHLLEEITALLEGLEITPLVDTIVLPSDAGAEKPAPVHSNGMRLDEAGMAGGIALH